MLSPFFRNGICKEVNDCNPKTKLFKFGPSEQWVMGTADTCRHQGETTSYVRHPQRSVKRFLAGFRNGRLKYFAIVQFWGGQRNILRVILGTLQECFYTTL